MSTNNTYDFNRAAKSDDSISNSFTKEHLKIAESNFSHIQENWANGILKNDYEHIQLKKTNPQIIKREYVKFDSNGTRYQLARVGGRNPKINDIGISLSDRGYILTEPMPILFYNNDESYNIITGMTRDYWLDQYNFDNMIAYVYEAKPGATEDGIKKNLSEAGIYTNPKNPPSASATQADIIQYGVKACDKKWIPISNVSEGKAYDLIKKGIKKMVKQAGLGDRKLSFCVQAILNQAKHYQGSVVLPFNNDDAKTFLIDNNYNNIKNKIRWIVKSYDMPEVAIVSAIKEAAQYPNHEVRLVIHCGILGADAKNTYEKRMTKFWNMKEGILNSFQQVIFDGQSKSIKNFVLYGGVPQVSSEHNMKKIVKYNQLDGSLSQ
tara:strand:+ start:1650 stop:2786 length:1137 start_codon:yes stop_codon:yes gene_type:complete